MFAFRKLMEIYYLQLLLPVHNLFTIFDGLGAGAGADVKTCTRCKRRADKKFRSLWSFVVFLPFDESNVHESVFWVILEELSDLIWPIYIVMHQL